MTEEEFAAVLALGHELTGIEFKEAGPASGQRLFAQVTKAVLGMANRRDGGRVVIGVENDGGVLNPVGLSNSDQDTWKYDDVAAKLAEYADPSVSFELEIQQHNSNQYLVLHVREFEDIPVLCKKDYQGVLRRGACYVRPRRKPETTEIPTQEDMRDLLDLATEKRLRRYLEMVWRAGGIVVPFQTSPIHLSEQELFDKQLTDLMMTKLLEKIRSRGHWKVVIRPGRYVEKRIQNISALYAIVQKASVELRGWDFPHVDPHTKPHIDVDWVGQESEWQEFLEIWRFYQSGQFVDIFGIPDDWQDQSNLQPVPQDWKPGALLGIGNALFTFTEIFEFAARLALTEVGDELMHIEVVVSGLNGRILCVDSRHRTPFIQSYQASLSELPYKVVLSRSELVAQPRELALKPTMELFARFGWEPGADVLRDQQKTLWLPSATATQHPVS